MAFAQSILSLVAALFFLLIALEELPIRLNIARVRRQVERRAARRGVAHYVVLDSLRRNTVLGVWILLAFASVSTLLLAVRAQDVTAASWRYEEAIFLFGGTCVLGLVVLGFAFHVWAPRLLDAVERELESTAEGSKPATEFGQESP